MGIGNIGWGQLLVVLVIVLLIFGTKRIRNIGSDLGGAIREFRKGVGENDNDSDKEDAGDGQSQDKSSKRTDDKDQKDESTSTREH